MPIFTIGRKAKDRRDLEAIQKTGGAMTIRSKNRIADPTNQGKTLGRGSVVTISKQPVVTQDKPTPVRPTVSVKKETSSTYIPGDFQGKVQERHTGEHHVKELGENPAKVKLRMAAQQRGETEYTTPAGKKEYAGRIKTSTTYTPTVIKNKPTPGKIHMAMTNKTTVKNVAPQDTKPAGGRGRTGLVIHRSSGTNRKGKPQNYTSVELGGKKLIKFKRGTPGTGSRSRTLRKY